MDFHMVDMIIVGLILFLAIRGLVNGFSKELFNFLALVGGVAVAARAHAPVAELINEQNILPAMNADFQKFIGFLVIILIIWVVFSIVSSMVTRFTSTTPGFFSRILGYIIGVGRYIFIFAVIIFGISNSDFLKENLSKHYEGSQLFAPMASIGAQLLNMDQKKTKTQKPAAGENNESNTTDANISVDLNKMTLTEHNSSH